MNQIAAMRETLTRAQEHGMADISGFAEGCDYWHLQDMVERAQSGEFSEAKLGRWLGWMRTRWCPSPASSSTDLQTTARVRLE